MDIIKLSELVKLKGSQHVLLGNSGSGKTYFVRKLIEQIKQPELVYVFGSDEKEWNDFGVKIQFINKPPFQDDFLFTLSNSVVVFDDYRQEKSGEDKFYKFVNFNVRHNKLCFILITHSVFKSNLYSKIISSPSIFLTPSPANLFFVQKFDKTFGTNTTDLMKQNIKEHSSDYRPILYITPKYVINSVEELITPTTHQKKVRMFKQDREYYLLDTVKFKFEEESLEKDETSDLSEVLLDFQEMYPVRFKKIKKFIILLYDFLKERNLLSKQEIRIGKIKLSLHDFIISSQDFSKNATNSKTKTVLTYLKKENFKVPRFTVHSPLYRQYIT